MARALALMALASLCVAPASAQTFVDAERDGLIAAVGVPPAKDSREARSDLEMVLLIQTLRNRDVEDEAAIDGELQGDDSAAAGVPLAGSLEANLSAGYTMRMEDPRPLKPKRLNVLRFWVESPDGISAGDLQLYLGMPAHAAVLRKDRGVFAHIHPSGTVPMAAIALAQQEATADPHAGHAMTPTALPADVSFPYGFPTAGDYRLFVQVKRAGKVETGVFDVTVND